MANLSNVPAPGLFLLPASTPLSSQSLRLIMKANWITSGWQITLAGTETVLFEISASVFSMSSRKTVFDGNNTPVLTIRKALTLFSHEYYGRLGEDPSDTGPTLFEFRSRSKFGSNMCEFRFRNAAKGMNGMAEMVTWKSSDARGMSRGNPVMWNGLVCGFVSERGLTLRDALEIEVAPGVDPLIVVIILTCEMDRRKK